MTSVHTHGARKSMRAIPLTQRQRKQGKPPERALSAPPQNKQATRGARAGGAALIAPAPSAPLASPSLRPASPLDLNAESGVSQALETPMAPVETLDVTERSAPPVAEIDAMVMTPSPETDVLVGPPSDPGAPPRRVKVRVRRKSLAPSVQDEVREINIEMEETTILPSLRLAPQNMTPTATLNITRNAETTVLPPTAKESPAAEPARAREAALPAETTVLILPTVETAPIAEAASVEDAPPIKAPPIAEAAPPLEDAPITKSALDTETTILAPSAIEAKPPMTNDATPEPRDAAPADAMEAPHAERQPAPEPRQAVITRKLPTLAVMAALASRAEARAEASALEESQAGEAPEQSKSEEAPTAAPDASSDAAPRPLRRA